MNSIYKNTDNNNLCIILARGGSKGLKNKNIKNFFGKPLIHYTIKPIIESGMFNKVIVSTDSEKIKRASLKSGAEVPFLRPAKLSNDNASYKDALRHSLDWVKSNYGVYENVLYAYPTNPLRKAHDFIQQFDNLFIIGRSAEFKYLHTHDLIKEAKHKVSTFFT